MTHYPYRVRVTLPHVTSEPNPVTFRVGEILGVGHHDQQWRTYVWCTDQRGHAGWVPDFYLEMTGPHEARALQDYDATELTVARGEVLEALDEAGGWLQCRNAAGLVGWIPADNVEPLEE